MATINWPFVGLLDTGRIDVWEPPFCFPQPAPCGFVLFPPISGETTIATYVNEDNLKFWLTTKEPAALDQVATIQVPIPCQLGDLGRLTNPEWGAELAYAYGLNHGRLIAARITCEGTHHILGVPTLFRYRVYLLHDQLPLLIGVAIVAAIFLIALDAGFSKRLAEVIKQITGGGLGPGSAVTPLLLFIGAGGLLTIGLMMYAQRVGGLSVGTFTPPTVPAVPIAAEVRGGPVTVRTAGFGGGGGAGGARSRRR